MEHALPLILDRRPLYPETVAVNVPRGTRTVLKRAAEGANISVSELIRRALDRTASEALARDCTHSSSEA